GWRGRGCTSLATSDRGSRVTKRVRRSRNAVSSPAMILGRLAVAAAIVLVAALAPAPARVRERRCQEAISQAGWRLLDTSLTSLAACRRAIARGALPAETDC